MTFELYSHGDSERAFHRKTYKSLRFATLDILIFTRVSSDQCTLSMASLRWFKRLPNGRGLAVNIRESRTDVATPTPSRTASAGVADPGRLLSSLPVSHGCLASHHRGCAGTERPLLTFASALVRSGMCIERCLHTSTSLMGYKWERRNKKVYPPQKPGEPPRMAEVHYSRRQIKHSMRKMWYISKFVEGMMIDDALTQLQFIKKKSAQIAREVLLEAQEEAVKNHNVEFKSNLHIAKSFVAKGEYDHAMRIHAKGRFGILDLVYCHFYVCLKEGPPPKKVEATGYDQAQHYMDSLRKRTIIHSM
ncbi:39S ribosomal protein L22, mitochondrial-like [Patiria miniata]|uniref:Large ribosomal subunit protein uL22m n=1 Tax=Patiria miniata TaxID=46514 RepID=A0A913ZUS7_PATMI|nr:39S ribosomal protein L22, mitochondrial-like [Patiria miniata]